MPTPAAVTVLDLTDAAGGLPGAGWLARTEPVHRELRPQLEPDYPAQMRRLAALGARIAIAVDGDAVLGVAVWRLLEKTHSGREVYIDDLVTASAQRSRGVGSALLAHVGQQARALGATLLTLDSGTRRERAHAFYFREGMTITSFHFARPL